MTRTESGLQPRPPRVLFVDGHADTRWAYVDAARAAGIEADVASDGWEAFARAIREVPDIVVTAMCLAGLDGLELTHCLRENDVTRSVPVIVVTGLVVPNLRERVYAAGCTALLSKPCTFDDVERAIWQALGARESTWEGARSVGD